MANLVNSYKFCRFNELYQINRSSRNIPWILPNWKAFPTQVAKPLWNFWSPFLYHTRFQGHTEWMSRGTMHHRLQWTLRTLLENGCFFPNGHLIEEPPGEAGCSDPHCLSTQCAPDCGTMRKIAKSAILFSAQFFPWGHSDTRASAFYGTRNRILSKWILNDQKLLDQKNSIYNKICHFKVNFIFFLPRGCEWTISCGLQ